MPKFNCSYAYDVPHYFDFVVEADTQEEAEKKCELALSEGVFAEKVGNACLENMGNDRVFVSGPTNEPANGPVLTEKGLVDE